MEQQHAPAPAGPDDPDSGRPSDAVTRTVRADPVVRMAAIGGMGWVLGYSLVNWLSRDTAIISGFVANILYLVPLLAAAFTAALAARRRWGQSRTGLAWAVFAISDILWLVGEVIWAGYAYLTDHDPPYPSLADWFYIAGYLIVVPGFFVAFGQGHRSQRARCALDLTLAAVGVGALGWHLLVAPQLVDTTGVTRLVTALYPLSDIAMLVCLLALGLSGHRRLPSSVRLVGWSYLAAAVTDLTYMYGTIKGAPYGNGSWLNDGYQLASALLALGGLVAARHQEPDAVRLAIGRDLTVVPLVAAGCCASVLVALDNVRAAGGYASLVVGALVVAGLMLRQYLVTRGRTRLTEQLGAALREQERLAVTDPLTGLYNRRFFEETLETEVWRARRSGRPLSLVALDLDHFKRINDGRGHPAGDAALVQAANRLRGVTRGGDVVARQGGEEFVWLLPETDEPGAAILAERLRTTLAGQPVELPGNSSITLTGSLGVATAVGQVDAVTLVRDADQAMYQAKALGRNRVVLASELTDVAPAQPSGRDPAPNAYVGWLADRIDAEADARGRSAVVADLGRQVATRLGLDDATAARVATAGRVAGLGHLRVGDHPLFPALVLDPAVVALVGAALRDQPDSPEARVVAACLAWAQGWPAQVDAGVVEALTAMITAELTTA